ncbi:MAG: ZIP family metal transporter [Planctomycetota bacterium]|nr:ZIP family metal transporter [Planctomycetota bacterium]
MDILGILLIALLGGAVPLLAKWGERGLHTALALSTGIFLGAVFLHLLPTVSVMSLSGEDPTTAAVVDPHAGHDHSADDGHEHADDAGGHAGHNHGDMWLWLFVLIGVLGVYLVEALVLRTHDHDELHRHKSVGWAALMGISVHALTAGISYGATRDHALISSAMLVAILAHKGFEAFSLTTVFQLAEVAHKKLVFLVVAFSLITPVGVLMGEGISSLLGTAGTAILTALAAGTFLYVCLCELLVEVFHHREDGGKKILLLAVGVGLTVIFEGFGHG